MMDFKPRTEGASPRSGELNNDQQLSEMRIPDLISVLRVATRKIQYDDVENELVAREVQHKGEVEEMRQILECERLERMKIEDKLKECQNLCEKGKRGEELYEKLLAAVKKNGLEDTTFDELRTRNIELKGELEIWKRKFVELGERVLRLECDVQLLLKRGNNEGDCGADPGVTIIKVKEEKETSGIHDGGGDGGNNNAVESSTVSRRNVDTCAGTGQSSSNPNKDVSACVRSGSGTIIVIEESDDDDKKKERDNRHLSSSVAAAQQKSVPAEYVIGMLKRRLGSRDSPRQFQKHNEVSSSSSSESSDTERLLKRCRAHTFDDRRKA